MTVAPLSRAGHLPTSGIADLSIFGDTLLSAFPVKRLQNARVLWLNERWFLEAGVDITQADIEADICASMRETYGVTAVHNVPLHAVYDEELYLGADRYGGTGGGAHGGSGRCGISGFFNAKGIGRTPLTPEHIPWSHAHGFVTMPEAIREIINAEVAAAELPFGAVPIIAMIDTGLTFKPDPNGQPERRVIAIRPNFVRPAHFERSIYFGSAGTETSDQYLDAQRVRNAIGVATDSPAAIGMPPGGFQEMILRVAEQVGAARAHRLWQGLFVTSNLTIGGSFVDFGAFRSLPDWRRCHGGSGEVFGDELRPMSAAIDSMVYYFRKYAPSSCLPSLAQSLKVQVESTMNRAFIATAAQGMGSNPRVNARIIDRLHQALWDYYGLQQKQRTTIESLRAESPWLSCLFDDSTPNDDSEPVRALRALYSEPAGRALDVEAAKTWLKPRPGLYYNVAHRHIVENACWLTGDEGTDRARLSRYINQRVAKSRRFWRNKPVGFDIARGVSNISSTILLGTGTATAWVEAPVIDKFAWVAGKRISLDAFEAGEMCGATRIMGMVKIADTAGGDDRLQIGSETIDLSQMSATV